MSDIRDAGYCAPGLRSFCLNHGINLRELVKNGIPVEDVRHIDDANLKRILTMKEES